MLDFFVLLAENDQKILATCAINQEKKLPDI
jgi:hypothetical protein